MWTLQLCLVEVYYTRDLATMHAFESGAQLTRFETGRPASKRVKGCESGRNT